MYVDENESEIKGKSYKRTLIRRSYRDENGDVQKETVLNISNFPERDKEAIKLALKNKNNLVNLANVREDLELETGDTIGPVYLLNEIAKRTGLKKALGRGRNAKVALLQVMGAVINPGSRLSTVRLAKRQSLCEYLGIKKLDEYDLYKNLSWLAKKQPRIEKRLFEARHDDDNGKTLFLYDVTSSYLEGEQNYFADYGYNRDKKRGKKQIVIGLLCDAEGAPASIDVFPGNTKDNSTFGQQVEKVARRFNCENVALVGDRGMIKSNEIDSLDEGMNYITAITKPQIKKLMKDEVIQLDLFETNVCEVEYKETDDDGNEILNRYVLRKNPKRRRDIRESRLERMKALRDFVQEKNKYLEEHSRAHLDVAVRDVREKLKKLKLSSFIDIIVEGRKIQIDIDREKYRDRRLLDGCYTLKTDMKKKQISAEDVHARYKDLINVERAFRTMKKVHLRVRPIYVCSREHTIGKVFITMLGYLLKRKLEKYWKGVDMTVQEGLAELSSYTYDKVELGNIMFCKLPKPREDSRKLLRKAKVELDGEFTMKKADVDTKNKIKKEL